MLTSARTSKQTVYHRDNTKKAIIPYFHCGPFKEKEKKGNGAAKIH